MLPLERAADAGEAWNSDQWRYSACICLESKNICLLWKQWTFCCSRKITRFVLAFPTQARTTIYTAVDSNLCGNLAASVKKYLFMLEDREFSLHEYFLGGNDFKTSIP